MSQKTMTNIIWVEQFRPSTIEDTLLPQSMKRFFLKILRNKDIPNLLFYSTSPGVGKTTVAKALCKEVDLDYIYINASNSGIDVLRTQITKFAHVKSLHGGPKVVILDEFDGATPQLQAALRADIEKFHKTCRFIFTANSISKIIVPLQSRCQIVDFNMTDKKIVEKMAPKIVSRLVQILKFQKVDFNQKTIEKIVSKFYPDIRKMINLIQQYSNTYGIIDENIFSYEKIDDEFYQFLLNKQLTKARKYLIEKNYNYSELFTNLDKHFIPLLPTEKQSQVILLNAEYMFRHSFVVDPEINVAALLLEIIGVL